MKRTILTLGLIIILFVTSACGQDEDVSVENTPVAAAVSDTQPDENGDPVIPLSTPDSDSEAVSATATPEPTATNTPQPTATHTPISTPSPPKEITICMGQEPLSLYLYGDTSLAATAVRHALYENLYTNLSYDYQPQGLEKLPNLADGDALINSVEVGRNDRVVTAGGNITELITGVSVINSEGEIVSFDGETPISVSQMSVQFRFKPMTWANGTPVTAEDSVYSFQLHADPITPGSKFKIERTESYTAVDELTVRWVGQPGYLDPDYFTNVWQPLPRHQLSRFQAVELITAEETTHVPLGNGPYSVAEWEIGDHIILQANPNYYRAAEGLPHIDTVTIRFHPDIREERPSDCDLITQEAASLEQVVAWENEGGIVPHYANSGIFEHIALGINSYDDYGDGNEKGRPDWFEDTRVRQALAHCINRQRIVTELTFGKSEEMHAYIPDNHPLFPTDATIWPYDPAAGNALLDEVGHVDFAGDGLRQDVNSGLPFTVTLGTSSGGSLREQINELVKEDLTACGIGVQLYTLPTAEWFADGPTGPMFGRKFDLAEFAWLVRSRPSCHLWLTQNIPGPEPLGFGGWGNVNITGWSNEAYDAACNSALNTLLGMENYITHHQEAVRIFTQELPVIPLLARAKSAVTLPTLLNFNLDPTQPSELWNIGELDTEVIGNR